MSTATLSIASLGVSPVDIELAIKTLEQAVDVLNQLLDIAASLHKNIQTITAAMHHLPHADQHTLEPFYDLCHPYQAHMRTLHSLANDCEDELDAMSEHITSHT